jgi:hypothetical protein
MSSVLVDVVRNDGTLLAAGLIPGPYGYDDLVHGGAVMADGQWRVRYLVRLPSGYDNGRGCGAESAAELVPGGAAIGASCITGGTNRVGYVTILGVNPESHLPEEMRTFSCSVTSYELNGNLLQITSSGELPNTFTPGDPQPDFNLSWDSRHGGLEPDNPTAFASYCSDGPYRRP